MNDVNNTKDKPVKAMLLARFCEELCAEHVFIVESRGTSLGHIREFLFELQNDVCLYLSEETRVVHTYVLT